jgi:hypothetical protein
MSIIFGSMKEECNWPKETEHVYRKSVESAMQGASRIKHIGNIAVDLPYKCWYIYKCRVERGP